MTDRVLIDEILTASAAITDDDLHSLSVIVGQRAFMTCTSGTTGKPKVIVHTHESALWQAGCYRDAGILSHRDTIIAWASSSFVIHIIDLTYTWPIGASLVVLKEGGNMDADYLTRTVERHHATYLLTSPVLLPMFTNLFRQQKGTDSRISSLRVLSTAGTYAVAMIHRHPCTFR